MEFQFDFWIRKYTAVVQRNSVEIWVTINFIVLKCKLNKSADIGGDDVHKTQYKMNPV